MSLRILCMQLSLQNITVMHVIHYNYTCKTYIMHFLVQKLSEMQSYCSAILWLFLIYICYKCLYMKSILYIRFTTVLKIVPSFFIKTLTGSSVSSKPSCYRPLGDVVNDYLVAIFVA